VLKHEHFEEICAAAAIGEASPAELAELERHSRECDACRQDYSECLELAARQFAAAEKNPELSAQEAESCLNSERFIQRFFERAEREGITFSPGAAQDARETPACALSFRRRPAWRIPVFVAAAAVVLVAFSTVYFAKNAAVHSSQAALVQDKSPATSSSNLDQPNLDQRLLDLKTANAKFESQVQQLAAELSDADGRVSKAAADLQSSAQDRQRLLAERESLATQLQDLQKSVADSEALAATAHQQSAQFRDRADDLQASFVAQQTRIQDLTDQLTEKSAALDRERRLLAVGHDVSDLMGARNLHIVDVVDTDAHGKNRPAFGRIFFTEGKSLIFYAYDLNEARIEKANYQYRIWSKKEGQDPGVQSLGIFYSDDKAQRRWVFKCDDPKILSEIDSVFVTLEPANSDPAHPKGSNLMYAYLRGQANHP
jgi:hypothetical protein